MKKSTERNRLHRMMRDSKMLYLNGLITTNAFDSMNKQLIAALKKL